MSNKNFKNQNRHNYNQYAKKEEVVEAAEETVEAVEDTVEEVKVTEDVKVTKAIENTDEETEAKAPIYGVVNCARLNIRRGPSVDTRPVTIVENGSELEIESFNDEWFKAVTQDGVSGYCMKKFVDEK